MRLIKSIACLILMAVISYPVFSDTNKKPVTLDKLPVEAFASLPAVRRISLSPSGNRVAVIQNIGEESFLVVYDLKTGKRSVVTKSDNKKVKIGWYRWANDDKLLVSVRHLKIWAEKSDIRRARMVNRRLLVFRFDGTDSHIIVNPKDVTSYTIDWQAQFQDRIVSILPDDPDHILMALPDNSREKKERADFAYVGGRYKNPVSVYKININNQNRERIYFSRRMNYGWLVDTSDEVRIGKRRENTSVTVYYQPPNEGRRQSIWQYDIFSDDTIRALGFDNDNKHLYVTAYYNDRKALFRIDADSEWKFDESTLVHSDPQYDVSARLIRSNATRKVQAFWYYTNKFNIVYFDEDYEVFRKSLSRAAGKRVHIVSRSQDDNSYIAALRDEQGPSTYYVGNLTKQSVSRLFSAYPKLDGYTLPEKKRINYTASDGIEIEGYLTLPNIPAKKNKKIPLIVHPHGGPISRDIEESFDYWVAFFASRGYAVLQVNFRGSSGYGNAFLNLGLKNWGKEMQSDITDGLKWAIANAPIDKDKVCIVGASYGGYAALMGAVQNSDLYQCAVSFAGVSDLPLHRQEADKYEGIEVFDKQIGDRGKELKAASPTTHVEKINIPILLAHGEFDTSVGIEQSRAMQKALKKHKKKFEYLELTAGDHYLSVNGNRVKFFKAMDEFLAKYLK